MPCRLTRLMRYEVSFTANDKSEFTPPEEIEGLSVKNYMKAA
jgi:hypothetical protein